MKLEAQVVDLDLRPLSSDQERWGTVAVASLRVRDCEESGSRSKYINLLFFILHIRSRNTFDGPGDEYDINFIELMCDICHRRKTLSLGHSSTTPGSVSKSISYRERSQVWAIFDYHDDQ